MNCTNTTLQETNISWEKENNLQKCLRMRYVGSQEGIYSILLVTLSPNKTQKVGNSQGYCWWLKSPNNHLGCIKPYWIYNAKKNYQPQLVFVQDFFHHQEHVTPSCHISQQKKKPAEVTLPLWSPGGSHTGLTKKGWRPHFFEDTKIAFIKCKYVHTLYIYSI